MSAPETPTTPIVERWAGSNKPYRGAVDHGVPDTEEPMELTGYDNTIAVPYADDEPEPKPVLVKIVQSESNERKLWRPDLITVANNAVRIIGAAKNRTVQLRNDGPADVFLSSDPGTPTWLAYRLKVNGNVTIAAEDDVYAVAAPVVAANADVKGHSTLVARGTQGSASTRAGNWLRIGDNAEAVRLFLRVFAITGLAPTGIIGRLLVDAVGDQSVEVGVLDTASTTAVGTVSANTGNAGALTTRIRGSIVVTGGDATTVVDAALLAFVDNPTADVTGTPQLATLSALYEYAVGV